MPKVKLALHWALARVRARHIMRLGAACIVASVLILLLETAALAQAAPANKPLPADVSNLYSLDVLPHTLGLVGVLFVAVGWFAKRDHAREKEFAAYRERTEQMIRDWGEQHRADAQRWEGRFEQLAKDKDT